MTKVVAVAALPFVHAVSYVIAGTTTHTHNGGTRVRQGRQVSASVGRVGRKIGSRIVGSYWSCWRAVPICVVLAIHHTTHQRNRGPTARSSSTQLHWGQSHRPS